MLRRRTIRWGVVILGLSMCAAAQDNSQPQGTAPSPAFGQSGAPILNPENPPLSGIDEPSLELKASTRSFISPALQVGESLDTNAQNQIGGSKSEAVSHVLGALDLQKFWPRSDLFLEYLGGAALGDSPYYARQIEAVGLEAVTRWRTGRLTLRDALNYLPDGSFFAGTAGALPGFGIATSGTGLGVPGIYRFGGANNGLGIGTTPRLSNTAILDMVQGINPRSAFTLVGAYSDSHFYHNTDNLVNGDQSTVEGGYSHLVSRHDQVAAVYAFQWLRFPFNQGGQIYNHVFVIRWSHTISGRMSFRAEVGPQYSNLQYGTNTSTWTPAARVILHYKFERAELTVSYDKFISEGSGFFAGADTQRAQAAVRRRLGRTYDLVVDGVYSHNRRLQASNAGASAATVYDETSVGFTLRKHLGRSFDAFAAYRYGDLWFDSAVTFGGVTGRSNQRNIATIGLEWHPKPTRIE